MKPILCKDSCQSPMRLASSPAYVIELYRVVLKLCFEQTTDSGKLMENYSALTDQGRFKGGE